jgi:hypothetical protein
VAADGHQDEGRGGLDALALVTRHTRNASSRDASSMQFCLQAAGPNQLGAKLGGGTPQVDCRCLFTDPAPECQSCRPARRDPTTTLPGRTSGNGTALQAKRQQRAKGDCFAAVGAPCVNPCAAPARPNQIPSYNKRMAHSSEGASIFHCVRVKRAGQQVGVVRRGGGGGASTPGASPPAHDDANAGVKQLVHVVVDDVRVPG